GLVLSARQRPMSFDRGLKKSRQDCHALRSTDTSAAISFLLAAASDQDGSPGCRRKCELGCKAALVRTVRVPASGREACAANGLLDGELAPCALATEDEDCQSSAPPPTPQLRWSQK